MTVVFDTEPLLAFSFDEPGAGEVERWLDKVYDGKMNGYVSTINLAEFRYIASRKASMRQADAHINDIREVGLNTINIDDQWEMAAELKARYHPSIADAYAVACAKSLDNDVDRDVTLLVDADDDYDVFEEADEYKYLIVRFRDNAAD